MFLDLKLLLRMHPEMLLFGNEIVHFSITKFLSVFSVTQIFLMNFKKLSIVRYQQNKTDNFLHTKITRRLLILIQNGRSLICYIRIFTKDYYYERSFMILASSKNGIGVGGFMRCAMCIKSTFYVFLWTINLRAINLSKNIMLEVRPLNKNEVFSMKF